MSVFQILLLFLIETIILLKFRNLVNTYCNFKQGYIVIVFGRGLIIVLFEGGPPFCDVNLFFGLQFSTFLLK